MIESCRRRVDVHFEGVDGQPALELRLEVVNGLPQCRELRIASVDGGREVEPLDLRAIRLPEWTRRSSSPLFALDVVDERDGNITMAPPTSDVEHLGSGSRVAA